MPRNSGGVYTVPPGTLATTGTVIASAPYNAMLTDVSTALTQSFNVNGTAMALAALNMGNQKINNVGVPTAATDAASKGYVDRSPTGWSFRNRIINGEMSINQRGASSGSAQAYTCDRWALGISQPTWGTWSLTSSAPPQFNGCFSWTSSGTHTCATGDYIELYQPIEANFFSDSLWGTSGGLPATLTFWASATATGTYGGSIRNYAETRTYAFSYSISAANTWTPITVPVPPDTSGTWVLSGSNGTAFVTFSMGAGSTYTAPSANTWLNGNYLSPPGCVQVCGTGSGQLSITGVQFELSPVSSSYERRNSSIELVMCERYFQQAYALTIGYFPSSGYTLYAPVYLPTAMRGTPSFNITTNSSSNLTGTPSINLLSLNSAYAFASSAAAGAASINCAFTISSEL